MPHSLPRFSLAPISGRAKSMLLATTFIGGLAAATISPVQAQDADAKQDRIEALEQQLRQVLSVVEGLTAEIQTLKAERATVPSDNASMANGAPQNSTTLNARIDAVAASVEETKARLDDVEEIALETDEKVGSRALVRAFDAYEFDLGGFLHTAATFADGKNNSALSVNRMTFEILAKAKLSEDWSLFVAQAFIRESNINFTDPFNRLEPNFTIGSAAPLVIATATYEASDALSVDLGRFITPHGIINVEHFPAILLDPEQPQFLRPFGGQTIFANFMNGAKIGGQFFEPGGLPGKLGYSLYVGSFVNNADAFNYGGRLFWTFADTGVTLGANLGGGRRGGDGTDYVLYGADLMFDKGPIIWKSEIFVTDEDVGGNRLAFYTQPGWRITDRWTAFYRFDFLDDGGIEGDKTEHAVGLTYKPHRNVHLRAIARFNHFEEVPGFPSANARNVQFSSTFSF